MPSVEAFVYRDLDAQPLPLDSALVGISETDMQQREALARREARQEAERGWARDLERRVEQEREAVAEALRHFELERQRYFRNIEREVVQLSLGIARKVLQREAQMDPLLLAGAARVALEQLAGTAQVELHVPLSRMEEWEKLLAGDAALQQQPRLKSDPSLEPAGCRIETATGSTDLSLDAQLHELEQGLMDLLDRRTSVAPAPK
ncbi:MAG: FliH/SctL family protein [Terriglobales bacterium]